MNSNFPLIGISGPTASGKSDLAVELAIDLNAEIINVDSVQLYSGLDIGSGKITAKEMKGIRHHLLSSFEPNQEIDAWSFTSLARNKIEEVSRRGKASILAGGSGLYLQSVIHGLIDDTAVSEQVKAKFEARSKSLLHEHGEQYFALELHRWLEEIDPVSAAEIQPADRARTGRAILCFLETGSSIRELQLKHANQSVYSSEGKPFLVIALLPEREELYKKINIRVVSMWESGLVEEVEAILEKYPNCKQLSAVGYRHAAQFISGEMSKAQAVEEMQKDTRRLAKRQLTWWRNQPSKLGWNYIDIGPSEGLEPSSICDISALIGERFGSEMAVENFLKGFLEKGSGEDLSGQVFFLPFTNVKL